MRKAATTDETSTPLQFVVMDAGPLIDYLTGREAGVGVRERLADPAIAAHAHALNLVEVFYHFSRLAGSEVAQDALATLEADGLMRSEIMDAAFCRDVAELKAAWKRVSLADCCGLALARRLQAEFFTSDRHELQPLEKAAVCAIVFAR